MMNVKIFYTVLIFLVPNNGNGDAMKTPICGVCLKSDILCKACKEKVEKGEIGKYVCL